MNPTINVTFAIGDRVTPENVAALPVGTVVEWTYECRTYPSVRVSAGCWVTATGDEYTDHEIAYDDVAPAFIVALGGSSPDRLAEHVAAVTPQYRERARAWLAAEHVDMVEELAALLAAVSGESCA